MRSLQQHLKSDCAAACLVFVAQHHKLAISLAMARRLAGTTPEGTTAFGIVEAAEKLGFSAKGVRGGPAILDSCPKPAIAHLRLPSGRQHFVVLARKRGDRLKIFDPQDGRCRTWLADGFAAQWTGILIILAPGSSFESGDRTSRPIPRLLRLLWRQKGDLVQILIGAVLLSALGLAMSFYVQRLLDDVIPAENRSLLNLLGVAMVVLIGFRLLLGWFQFVHSMRLAQRLDSALILAYYRHLLRLPQTFFDGMRVGEMTSRINDAVQIRTFLSSVVVTAVLNPVILVACFGAMFVFSKPLALLTLTQVPLQGLAWYLLNRINRKYQRAIKERAADLNAHVTETLQLAATVKRCGLESFYGVRTEAHLVRLLRTAWAAGMESNLCGSVSGAGSQLFSLAILWFGTRLVLGAGLTPGEMMSCYTLAMWISAASGSLIGLSSDLQQAVIAADRLFEILDEEPEPPGGSVVLSRDLIGPIEFRSVTFRHRGRAATLRDVTLTLPAGSITALTGASGSGKSTLLALLQRTYLADSGTIRIGKIDFDYIGTASLRACLAVLPQRVELTSGTLLSTIALGDPAPDLVRATEICGELGILEFIESLPQKFNTPLGEGGLSLSGGQRQRIALARTFYRDAPIVLLDEPTLGLDRRATRCVVDMLKKARARGATVVVVSHSPPVVRCADRMFVFKEGRVEEPAAANPSAGGDRGLPQPESEATVSA